MPCSGFSLASSVSPVVPGGGASDGGGGFSAFGLSIVTFAGVTLALVPSAGPRPASPSGAVLSGVIP